MESDFSMKRSPHTSDSNEQTKNGSFTFKDLLYILPIERLYDWKLTEVVGGSEQAKTITKTRYFIDEYLLSFCFCFCFSHFYPSLFLFRHEKLLRSKISNEKPKNRARALSRAIGFFLQHFPFNSERKILLSLELYSFSFQ